MDGRMDFTSDKAHGDGVYMTTRPVRGRWTLITGFEVLRSIVK